MASETVLEVLVRRHVLTSDRPIPEVLDAIFGGISPTRHRVAASQAGGEYLL
jgi:hypothetical protein